VIGPTKPQSKEHDDGLPANHIEDRSGQSTCGCRRLSALQGAVSRHNRRREVERLLIRDEDVEVLHGFDTPEHASAYLKSQLFTSDVVRELKPLLDAEPDVRIYKPA
jgi:hypothetical protein